ncbi:hypothetical protein EZH22_01410 [Xanthobacter dioxanivorans]|uniref:Uncharacterized protein n=1 Tax=Xanthobacter dioxanivorans TaxID=2528964 RepID=A0A974SIV6_9HYPH|nr:hypothetical protein [Xanthobacter dioxanivorans]QRG07135.1 hypothetical protein EZH22_01410 [Xanthobacter dioxanivorans]
MADTHKLPAYDAIQSLYGISRAILMTTNYLDEGRVRHRRFENIKFEFNLLTQNPGSFETLFELITNPDAMKIGYDISVGITSGLLGHFIISMLSRAVGGSAHETIEDLETSEEISTGDTSALVEAIEPSLREGHKIVGNGASNIFIITGSHNTVNFNAATKSFVNAFEEDNVLSSKIFSVASFNSNSGYGRAFDFEELRTIPFEINTMADEKSIEALIWSFSSYARRRRLGENLQSAVAFKYRAIRTLDGRVKKIKVIKVRRDIASLDNS